MTLQSAHLQRRSSLNSLWLGNRNQYLSLVNSILKQVVLMVSWEQTVLPVKRSRQEDEVLGYRDHAAIFPTDACVRSTVIDIPSGGNRFLP